MTRRRGAEAGDQNVQWLKELIAECEAQGTTLPTRGNALNHKNILERVGPNGVGRHVLQDNEEFVEVLRAYAFEKGLAYSFRSSIAPDEDVDPAARDCAEMVSAARLREAQMRLAQADRRNAELRAENANLRAQILRGSEVAELIALGGRIKPGGS
ncbi:hypothetical protein H8A97_35360 [Bradyrhizobium sp. Arg62]|uniref:hypothetical protein n=1 Tax=Bradyrhizobium brasilense TaxID=1419277 RepID=UPI001E60482F|nr:hypothetical protein [Bradyrhizobium brasilense]MCC8950217.1 hypothetical protein [Bradyrhizobium brasilense]